MNSCRILLVVSLIVILFNSPIFSQITITEIPIQNPLDGVYSSQFHTNTDDEIFISGLAQKYQPTGGWEGYRLIYLMIVDSLKNNSTFFFPDTGWYWGGMLNNMGIEYRLQNSIAVDKENNIIALVAKQYAITSDIPPFVTLGKPTLKCYKKNGNDINKLFEVESSASPNLTTGIDNTTHFSWEEVTPLEPDSNYAVYSSKIYYRNMNSSGVLSQPVFIDSGFNPHLISTGPNSAYLFWFSADSSNSLNCSFRFTYIFDGNPTSITTIKDSINISQLRDLSVKSDIAGNVYLAWLENIFNNRQIYLAKINETNISFNNSNLFPNPKSFRMLIKENGMIDAIWTAGYHFDSLYFARNYFDSLFSDSKLVNTPQNFLFKGEPILFLNNNGNPGCFFRYYGIHFIQDIFDMPDSIISYNQGSLLSSLQKTVFVDSTNTWLFYKKNDYALYQMGILKYSDKTTSINDKINPYSFHLEQNYPNPFNPSTIIEYSVANNDFVSIKVYDVLGSEVAELVNEVKEPGIHQAVFNGKGFSSGVYFYKLTNGTNTLVRKMLLLK